MNDPMVAELLRCLAENSLMRREAMNGLVEQFREQEREIAELRKALGVVEKSKKMTGPTDDAVPAQMAPCATVGKPQSGHGSFATILQPGQPLQ